MVRPLHLLVTVVALAGVLAACGGGGDSSAGQGQRVTDPGRVPTSTPVQNARLFQIRGEQVSAGGAVGTVTPVSGGSSQSGRTYTVKSGDTCAAIASQYGVSTDELLRTNRTIDANCSNLRVGDILRIPGATPTPAGTRGTAASKEYRVQSGDNCGAIAASYGVSVADLIAKNGLDAECRTLKVGQVLKIP